MTPKIRFRHSDLYYIDRVPYHFQTSDDRSACFRREDGSGALEWFGWEDLNEIVGSDRWECKFRPSEVEEAQGAPDPLVFIWELPEKQRKLILYRWFFVCALEKLYTQCLVKLTPTDVIRNYYTIHTEATKEWRAFCGEFGQQYYCSKDTSLGATPSASSILKWRRMVKRARGRIDALLDKRGRATGLKIDQESYRFIIESLREYLLDDRHTGNEVIEKTIGKLKAENKKRAEAGEKLLETRCRTVLHKWIENFGGYEIDLGRKGKNFAVRKYGGVGKTERATRVGQTFMVDEWEVDARNLALAGPIREGLDQQTIDAIKAMPKTRRWMYVVVDVATRYIAGFGLSETQNSEAAVRALRMATQDKTDIALAAGCACEWRSIQFESLESDTGSAFRAKATQRAVSTACATYVYPQVGQPQLRGIIERIFLTFTLRAMPYIPGRTFSSPKQRGNYDTEGRAVLSDDQLAMIFIRYIVDVYHQTKHTGLFGETPEDALIRIGGTTGMPPKLSLKTRRRAFGIRQKRTITARGIRFLGIDYGGNSEELHAIRKGAGTNKIAFYVDPDDLGTISVWNDGEWLDVGCSVENFYGIRLVDWVEVGKILRPRYSAQAEMKTSIILAALSDMKKRSTNLQKIMGVLPQMYTSEDLERIDRELYWGLSVIDDAPIPLSDLQVSESGIGYVIGNPSKKNRPSSKPTMPDAPLSAKDPTNDPDNQAQDFSVTEISSSDVDRVEPPAPPNSESPVDGRTKPWWHKGGSNG